MKIKNNGSGFDPCPEFTGKAVCVDGTPLRRQQSQYGDRDVFKLVFEVDLVRTDGTQYCVWSRNFTPSLNEKSNFRKFLRAWNGRDLTEAEQADFDTESLIGRPAQVVVVHEHKDGEVYANIAACTPDRSGAGLKATGKYVRVKDRAPKTEGGGQRPEDGGQKPEDGGQSAGQRSEDRPGGGGGYRRAEQPAADAGDLGATKIHVGRCKGLEVRDLAPEQVAALIERWLPTAKGNAKPTADDRRLMAALEWWQAAQGAAGNDDVPY